MKKILIFTIGTLVLSGLALSAHVGSHRAFGDGEKLVYAVSYKVSFVNTDVAEVSFLTNFNSSKGTPVYKIEANGKTYPFYKWFFDLNDTYTSTLDSATLRPLELKTELKEGKYRYSSRFHYDWENKKVHTAYRNHKNPDSTYKSLKLTEGGFDETRAGGYHPHHRIPFSRPGEQAHSWSRKVPDVEVPVSDGHFDRRVV